MKKALVIASIAAGVGAIAAVAALYIRHVHKTLENLQGICEDNDKPATEISEHENVIVEVSGSDCAENVE